MNLHGFVREAGGNRPFLRNIAPETSLSISNNFQQKSARKGADSRNFRPPGRLFCRPLLNFYFWVFFRH